MHRGKGHLWEAVQSYQLTVLQCQLPGGHPEKAAQERQYHTRDWNGCPYSNKTYTGTCNQHTWNSHPMQPHAPHTATPWYAHALTQLVSQVIINAICVHTTKWQYYSTQKKSYLREGGRIRSHLNLSFAWRCVMHARQLNPLSFTLPCYNSSPLELSSKWNIGYHYRSSWRKQYPLCLLGA